MRVEGRDYHYHFSVADADGDFVEMGMADTKYLSSETNGGFTGVTLGLYTTTRSALSDAVAEFEYFDYQAK